MKDPGDSEDKTVLCLTEQTISRQLLLHQDADGIVVYPFNPLEEQSITPGDEQTVRVAPFTYARVVR